MDDNLPMVSEIIADAHNDSAKKDFEKARANVLEVINTGIDALQNLAQVADTSQEPRAYEVLAKLTDSLINANKELLNLQQKIRDINVADAPHSEHAKTINNNLFVGSTAELQKMIENMKNGGPTVE